MSRRVSIALVALVLLVQAAWAGATPANAARQGVEGNSYVSETYGWSVSWGDEWTVENEESEDGYEGLELTDNLSVVYFEAYEDYEGDPAACVADELDYLNNEDGVSDVEIGTDRDGEPLTGEDSAGAYTVYTFTYSPEEGEPYKVVEYNDCRTLVEGEAVLEISQITLREAYNDANPGLKELLDNLAMPGEDPVDDDGAEDAPEPPDDEVSEDELLAEVDETHALITEYWTDQFETHDLFYVEPIYVVLTEEQEVPCNNGEVVDRGSGSFYCPLTQTIYFDLVQLAGIQETTGVSTGALEYVLAHEAGHDVQMQLGITLTGTLSVEQELEADCMAGAFLRTRVDDRALEEAEFFALLDIALYIGDPAGTRATDEGSHGLGSQRVTLMLRGYYNGVDACGTFEDMMAPSR